MAERGLVRRLGAATVIAGLACGSLACADRASAETAIAVVGNHRLGIDRIKAFFHPSDSSRLTDIDLDAALKAMYRSGEYSNVSVKRDGATVRVAVQENPVITRVVFEGNRKLDDKKLLPILQSQKDKPLSRPMLQEDVERLIDAYHHIGRYNAAVVPQVIAHGNDRVDLVFEINEGERTGIGEITFAGNSAFPARTLKDVVKSGETN